MANGRCAYGGGRSVAAVGQLFGPNPERGVFKTSDGGRTWSRVLYVDENRGAGDIVMDPSNRTLPLWLRGLSDVSNEAVDWPAVMAGATLVAVPVIILFMIVQNRMTSGMVGGAVKG